MKSRAKFMAKYIKHAGLGSLQHNYLRFGILHIYIALTVGLDAAYEM